MSLRKKIFFSFFISAFIIGVLAIFEYVTFIQVKGEMRSLEVADTVRSKSLQLRRHEKNFLLYASKDELNAIYDYLGQLEDITARPEIKEKSPGLRAAVEEYRERFDHILELHDEVRGEFSRARPSFAPYERFASLVEANFLDKPGYVAYSLVKVFGLSQTHPLVLELQDLDSDIALLRENGEDIITSSKALDAVARSRAERGIHVSQIAIIAVFPLFLVIGLGALFFISNDLVKRLKTLTDSVEKTGSRYMPSMAIPEKDMENKDEVDVLVNKFSRMGEQLDLWEEELRAKNRELLESKKLAAIGTLASGVAHELNNPLNNIFLSVQILKKQFGEDTPPPVREIVEDVYGQTLRVKGIVGDLLEFAREREPTFEEVELNSVMKRAYEQVGKSTGTEGISFALDSPSPAVRLRADPGLLERVFVNLFSNAVAAIEGAGEIVAKVEEGEESVKVWVSDTGKGMSVEDKEKIFDPFFTKKDKGTGLGLAIVMNIVKKHRGTITVESEPGVGTAFEITLPKN
jgi:two-component system NtrC family sensor kinase